MQKITPFLWFDRNAEDAANYYLSIFPRSRITNIMRYGEGAPMPAGMVMTISFVLNDCEFTAINGGPHYTFSSATSFMVPCDSQAELDAVYDKLVAGGEAMPCGWLKDQFGVTWQVAPQALFTMLNDKDSAKVARVTAAMMQMIKLDLPKLTQAYEGR